MKKAYETPEIELLEFPIEDVICTSPGMDEMDPSKGGGETGDGNLFGE